MKHPGDTSNKGYAAHTCADQPKLPCPACLKWTGDAFATVSSSIDAELSPVLKMQYEESGFAVMSPVTWVDGCSWTTWMRYDTYEEAEQHLGLGQRIVRFGSAEWRYLLDKRSPER